jgi:hypothetical protein
MTRSLLSALWAVLQGECREKRGDVFDPKALALPANPDIKQVIIPYISDRGWGVTPRTPSAQVYERFTLRCWNGNQTYR